MNLKTGETDALPEGVTFHSAVKEEDGWLVSFGVERRGEDLTHSVFNNKYYDMEGNRYTINSWTTQTGGSDEEEGEFANRFILKFPLNKRVYSATKKYPH